MEQLRQWAKLRVLRLFVLWALIMQCQVDVFMGSCSLMKAAFIFESRFLQKKKWRKVCVCVGGGVLITSHKAAEVNFCSHMFNQLLRV